MRLTYTPKIDLAYLYLDQLIEAGKATHQRMIELPKGTIVVDLDDAGHILGIEFLTASTLLTAEVLASAELDMQEAPFHPSDLLRKALDQATPTPRDWVLYCPVCEFVGETNAAYATSFMADHNPPCEGYLRLWNRRLATV